MTSAAESPRYDPIFDRIDEVIEERIEQDFSVVVGNSSVQASENLILIPENDVVEGQKHQKD